MDGDLGTKESELLKLGIERLRQLLPSGWAAKPLNSRPGDTEDGYAPGAVDALLVVEPPHGGGYGKLIVDAKTRLGPTDVHRILDGRLDLIHRIAGPDTDVLVVAPWLSPRTRQLLRERKYGYLDLTGNAWINMERPGMFIRTDGSDQDPNPGPPRQARLTGSRAGRLVRLLVDVAPPYRAAELADRASLTRPYVSKLLDSLEDQALIERIESVIVRVDWIALLRARAHRFPLLKANASLAAVSPQGPAALLNQLRSTPELARRVTLTGSYAAEAVVPLSIGGQLMLYTRNLDHIVDDLGLLPTNSGAEVVLLEVADPHIVERPRIVDGLRHVALSQLALDCLSGNGRLPAEGEALLEYMAEKERHWRLPNLKALRP